MPITGCKLSWGDGPSRSWEADWFQRKGCWPLWDFGACGLAPPYVLGLYFHALVLWFLSCQSGWAPEWLDLCPAGPQGHGYLYPDFKGQGLPAVIDLRPQPWKSGWRSPGRENTVGAGSSTDVGSGPNQSRE